MDSLDFLKIAHIQLDNATFRVHVTDSDVFRIDKMNDGSKPDFVLWISKSNDPEQNKQSLLVTVSDDYNLEDLAKWIKSYEV